MEILRFITCGSVDDGKSTLIGRLLYDTGSLLRDQVAMLEDPAKLLPDGSLNFALLTDGLRAEREQGITIDVAYKYFQTSRRKFIIADTPGHVQYTRNMVTGASSANLAIILIDARNGVIEQTCRHAFITHLVRIPHLVVAINKMDLVDCQQEVFEKIRADFLSFAGRLGVQDVVFIPVVSKDGDNIVTPSTRMPWYHGRTLLDHLHEVHVGSDVNLEDPRLPVQYVIRPQKDELHDYRAFAGQIASGIFRKGDTVEVLPSGFKSVITAIDSADGEMEEAFAPMSVAIRLADEVDISRGDMIVLPDNRPRVTQDIEAWICWMDTRGVGEGSRFIIKHGPREAKAIMISIVHRYDLAQFQNVPVRGQLQLNDIARIRLRCSLPLLVDEYRVNRANGSFILIDEGTNLTVAAGVITHD